MSIALFSCHSASSISQSDTFKTKSGKQVTIDCYRHASLNIDYNGHSIQIDPVTDVMHGIRYDDKKRADCILITHEHFDHFDMKAIKTLSNENTAIILTKNCEAKLEKGKIMANGDSLQLPFGVSVKAVPAYNTTPTHLQYHPKGRDNGYIISIENLRIYIAGDTEIIPDMQQLGHIDIAFLPCNQPYTMTTDQLIEAAKIIHPSILYPYHYSDTDMSGIADKLKSWNIEVRLRNMN